MKYRRKCNYETAHLDEEWIVLNTDNYTLTKLNETGGYCWNMLSEAQTVETLSDAIIDKFDASSERVEEDIEIFIKELIEYGLIENVV